MFIIKKKNCYLVDLAVLTDHRVKMKKSKKINKYFDLFRKLKKMWQMKLRVISMIIGALGTVPDGLEKRLAKSEIRAKIKTIQTIALLRSAGILSKVLETWEDLLLLRLHWKTISKYWLEKPAWNEEIIIIIILIIIRRRMGHANDEKWKSTNDRRNRITKLGKNQIARRKGRLQVLGNIRSGHHQTSGDERKNQQRVSQENEKTTWNQIILH